MRLPEYDTADATELASWVARGDVHPRELVAAALERIEARNGALNAVDQSKFALAQSLARVFLLMLPFAWLLRPAWGAEAIYGAELLANLAGGAIAAAVAWRLLARNPQG